MARMHISITGDLGSGKSTVAKALSQELGLEYLSTGGLQRQLAANMGMNTLEFNRYTNENLNVDDFIDQRLRDINNAAELYILDSRLAWHFVTSSFKVYLTAADEVAAARVLIDTSRVGEPLAADVASKMLEQRERRTLEDNRFAENYGIKPSIYLDFDAVIDTSTATVEQVKDTIKKLYFAKTNAQPQLPHWLSPKRLLPSSVQCEVAYLPAFLQHQVICMYIDSELFIINEQEKVRHLLLNNAPLVPLQVVNESNEVLPYDSLKAAVIKSYSVPYLKKWEADNGFEFYHYPKK